ncbi:Caspase-14 [Orchesella cincta]|uniref:Caspase-14 n=1 Tax=Orchesella cincta TaxID=48709 RepID=A0A1D2N6F5_ORCCI|nr:Caspase-14 [Orchesella cincta]
MCKGYSYILKGQINAQTESKNKYLRSASTRSKFSLWLSNIQYTFYTVNQRISDSEYFTEDMNNIQIRSAQFYRYMGCEKCSTAIHYRDKKDGKYYCKRCLKKAGPRNRKVCLVLRNMVLQDSEGTPQGGFVCYSKGYEKLVKAAEIEKICESKTDVLARKKAKALAGVVVNVRIKHQRPTGSTTGRTEPSLIVEVLSIITETPSSEEEDSDGSCNENGGNDNEGQYPMISNPVGFALIVNMNFKESVTGKHRRGAEEDVKALKALFQSLNITAIVHEDITSRQLKSEIVEFKDMLSKKDASCCFVVFMSHGILYNVKMADDQRVNVFTDIMDHFSERNFVGFCGKPKIFVFQACNNFSENDLTDVSFLRDSTDMYSDMLYVTASLPGIKATRNKTKGSYFIQTFVKLLKRLAGNRDLENILYKIQEEMRDMRFGKERKRNIPMYSPILFRKFNFRLDRIETGISFGFGAFASGKGASIVKIPSGVNRLFTSSGFTVSGNVKDLETSWYNLELPSSDFFSSLA